MIMTEHWLNLCYHRFKHWFGINDPPVREKVAARYVGIQEECYNWGRGKTKTFCMRNKNTEVCPPGVIAATITFFPVGRKLDEITYCPSVRFNGFSHLADRISN